MYLGTFLVFVCIPCQAATRVQRPQQPLLTTSTATAAAAAHAVKPIPNRFSSVF